MATLGQERELREKGRGLRGKKVGKLMKVERFEDIIAWRKARELTKGIYTATSTGHLA